VPGSVHRLVLDTNTIVRAFINVNSASGRIVTACQTRRLVPLLSSPTLEEYRAVLARPELVERYPELDRPEIAASLERLRYVSDFYRRITTRFCLPRDPRDESFLELAIAGNATHLITADNDLLSLTKAHDDAAKRLRRQLPGLSVLTAEDFMRWHTILP